MSRILIVIGVIGVLLLLCVSGVYLLKQNMRDAEYVVVAEGLFAKAQVDPGDLTTDAQELARKVQNGGKVIPPTTIVYFTDGSKYVMEGYYPHATPFEPVVYPSKYVYFTPKVYPYGTKIQILQNPRNKKYKIQAAEG